MSPGQVRIINGRLSLITSGHPYPINFWTWRTVCKDGTLGKEYKGYDNGSQTMSHPIPHEIIIKVNSFDLLKVQQYNGHV